MFCCFATACIMYIYANTTDCLIRNVEKANKMTELPSATQSQLTLCANLLIMFVLSTVKYKQLQ